MSLRKSLILMVVLSAGIYRLVFSLPFPLSQLYNTIPPVDYAELTNYYRLRIGPLTSPG